MIHPLDSTDASVAFLLELANIKHQDDGTDLQKAKAIVAETLDFKDWQSLNFNAHRSCSLLDPSTICFTRVLSTNLQQAWNFVTVPSHLSTWMFETKLELTLGGKFEFPTWKGVIGRLEEFQCIRFSAEAGGYSQIEVSPHRHNQTIAKITDYLPVGSLVPDHLTQGDEVFGMRQHGGPGTHWAGLLAGWHSGSDSLEAYASGRENEGNYMALVRLYDALLVARHQN